MKAVMLCTWTAVMLPTRTVMLYTDGCDSLYTDGCDAPSTRTAVSIYQHRGGQGLNCVLTQDTHDWLFAIG